MTGATFAAMLYMEDTESRVAGVLGFAQIKAAIIEHVRTATA
jgi:hypothetical protein